MKFSVEYRVFNIPNDAINMGQKFEFTYESEELDMSVLEEYLCEYFAVGNFEIEQVIELEK